jgi:hypothetical protein
MERNIHSFWQKRVVVDEPFALHVTIFCLFSLKAIILRHLRYSFANSSLLLDSLKSGNIFHPLPYLLMLNICCKVGEKKRAN